MYRQEYSLLRVVINNESQLSLFRNDGHPFVRCRPGDANRNDCMQPTLKHDGVMVWGCMTMLATKTGYWLTLCESYVIPLRGAIVALSSRG